MNQQLLKAIALRLREAKAAQEARTGTPWDEHRSLCENIADILAQDAQTPKFDRRAFLEQAGA